MRASTHRRAVVVALCGALLGSAGSLPDQLQASGGAFIAARSGRWSDPATWASRSAPTAGVAVTVGRGITVEYDVASDQELASLEIAGSLKFSRTRSTRLDVGNIFVREDGVLDMGTPERPIPAGLTVEIRFVVPHDAVFVGGDFAPSDVGLWVFHGGRWNLHGAAVGHTWTKLARSASAGDTTVVLRDDVHDWPVGATVVITPTSLNPRDAEFEERTVSSVRRQNDGRVAVTLTAPLAYQHDGGPDLAGEVALLTRNVGIMSKYPDRPKAHTMFMAGASGHIAYGEFRDLGTFGVVSRYPIHFHMMGESSRGMTVQGASIWRSGNHFVNIHGSNGIAVLNTVGYDAPGSGFFIESVRVPGAGTSQRQPRTKEDRRSGNAQQPSGADKRRAKEERRRDPGQRKGVEPSGNMDFVFTGNLAIRGVWRPGSLDDPPRAALFWIGAFNGLFMGNVAVGMRAGRDSSGFHFAEHADVSQSRPPLLMLANEAHSNASHGLFSWTNSNLPIEVIDFQAWRNGKTGVTLGAYNHGAKFFRLTLRENREANASVLVSRAWIQDSLLERSQVGVLFRRHPLPGLPEDPSMIINSQLREHSVADISQDHTPCRSTAEERSPSSRQCPPNYARFLGSQFHSRRAIDFGWHENASSWIDVIGWRDRPAGLPAAFRLVRKDQNEGTGVQPAFDAVVRPTGPTDAPPSVDLQSGQPGPGGVRFRARATDDRGITAVEFLADRQLVRRITQPPYEIVWAPRARVGRDAYLYARAIDTAGHIAYSRVIPLVARP